MDSVEKPTIVLCHGAWHVPKHYERFLDTLRHSGFDTHCPLLPTCNGARPANSLLADDVHVLKTLVESLVQRGRSVLVILHSSGGVVGSNALQGELSAVSRTSKGLTGGIVGIIYMCAFFLQPGETVKSATHVDVDPVIVAEDGTSTVHNPKAMFYHDVDPAEAEACVEILVPHSVKAFVDEVTGTPWNSIPTTYFYCSEDKVLWQAWQRSQVNAARDQGIEVHEESFESSHSPYLSLTSETASAVLRVWHRCT